MTRRCPICRAGYVRSFIGLRKRRCLPCRGTGRIQLIARDEYELLADWITPAQVMDMKARGELKQEKRA